MRPTAEILTAAELLQGTGSDVLVLSPHMDDAILSASAVVLQIPCEVWTVFAGKPVPARTTTWDRDCGFIDSDATIEARWAEDDAAFAGTPAKAERLPLWEGAYTDREERRRQLPGFEARLNAWMEAHPRGAVLVPVGAGVHVPPAPWERFTRRPATSETYAAGRVTRTGTSRDGGAGQPRSAGTIRYVGSRVKPLIQRALHAEHTRRRRRAQRRGMAANPDHLQLREHVLDLARKHPGVTVFLYEDLPYLWHERGDQELQRVIRSRDLRARRVEVAVNVDQKFSHVAAYVSQLDVIDREGRLSRPGELPTTEVFWLLSD